VAARLSSGGLIYAMKDTYTVYYIYIYKHVINVKRYHMLHQKFHKFYTEFVLAIKNTVSDIEVIFLPFKVVSVFFDD